MTALHLAGKATSCSRYPAKLPGNLTSSKIYNNTCFCKRISSSWQTHPVLERGPQPAAVVTLPVVKSNPAAWQGYSTHVCHASETTQGCGPLRGVTQQAQSWLLRLPLRTWPPDTVTRCRGGVLGTGARHANTRASFPHLAPLTTSLPSPAGLSRRRGTDRTPSPPASPQWVGHIHWQDHSYLSRLLGLEAPGKETLTLT